MESKLPKSVRRVVVISGWRSEGNGEILVNGYKLSVIRLTNSEDLMYSMVTIANNTVNC